MGPIGPVNLQAFIAENDFSTKMEMIAQIEERDPRFFGFIIQISRLYLRFSSFKKQELLMVSIEYGTFFSLIYGFIFEKMELIYWKLQAK